MSVRNESPRKRKSILADRANGFNISEFHVKVSRFAFIKILLLYGALLSVVHVTVIRLGIIEGMMKGNTKQ